jgi:hypothetical protein
VVRATYKPFAGGRFLFERGERHYEVEYRDPSGDLGTVICKTSLFTGVYWADDTLPPRAAGVRAAPAIAPPPVHSGTEKFSAYCGQFGRGLRHEWGFCPGCGAPAPPDLEQSSPQLVQRAEG